MMSVRILTRVWAQSRRRDGELLVMLALADFANDAGECWPSIPVLAAKARLTDRQVCRVLNSLDETGEIRRIRSTGGRNKRSRYFINLSENPDINSLKKLQGKNNPVIHDQKTLTPVSGALNRHRTVNKERGAKAPDSFSPIIEKTIRRLNELAGTSYRTASRATGRLIGARLAEGFTEEGLAMVLEHKWDEWGDNKEMAIYFRPETLFAAKHFEGYLQAAKSNQDKNGGGNPPKVVQRDGDMLTLEGGSIINAATYERRYGVGP